MLIRIPLSARISVTGWGLTIGAIAAAPARRLAAPRARTPLSVLILLAL